MPEGHCSSATCLSTPHVPTLLLLFAVAQLWIYTSTSKNNALQCHSFMVAMHKSTTNMLKQLACISEGPSYAVPSLSPFAAPAYIIQINVSWSVRQFILAPYVSQQLRGGASRNLVVRHYDRRITAESIRADLEHIHNLSVINIEFSGLDCYISINSITAASFARTCMMSRLYVFLSWYRTILTAACSPYRGSRIEWAPDECMQSLGQPKSKTATRTTMAQTKANLNRFSLLEIGEKAN